MKQFIISRKYQKYLGIFIWIVIWQIGAVLMNQPLYLPTPYQTILAMGHLIMEANFLLSLGATFLRVMSGFAISVGLGILCGALSYKLKSIRFMLDPLVSMIKPIPIMSIIILLLVWLKGSNVPVMVCILLCFPVIYTNTLEGLTNVDPQLLEMAKVFKIPRWRKYREIIYPSVRPYLFSSIMVVIGFSWKAVVTAEVLSAPKYSMGYNLYNTKLYLNTEELFAWTIVIIIFSLLIEKVFKRIIQCRI